MAAETVEHRLDPGWSQLEHRALVIRATTLGDAVKVTLLIEDQDLRRDEPISRLAPEGVKYRQPLKASRRDAGIALFSGVLYENCRNREATARLWTGPTDGLPNRIRLQGSDSCACPACRAANVRLELTARTP